MPAPPMPMKCTLFTLTRGWFDKFLEVTSYPFKLIELLKPPKHPGRQERQEKRIRNNENQKQDQQKVLVSSLFLPPCRLNRFRPQTGYRHRIFSFHFLPPISRSSFTMSLAASGLASFFAASPI